MVTINRGDLSITLNPDVPSEKALIFQLFGVTNLANSDSAAVIDAVEEGQPEDDRPIRGRPRTRSHDDRERIRCERVLRFLEAIRRDGRELTTEELVEALGLDSHHALGGFMSAIRPALDSVGIDHERVFMYRKEEDGTRRYSLLGEADKAIRALKDRLGD